MLKKILKITLTVIVVLLLAAFLLPIIFKDKIIRLAKEEINKSINAKADFADVDISLFRHFPKLSLGLKGLQVLGLAEFSNDTLLSVQRFDVAVDAWGAITGSTIKVYSVALDEPRINLIVAKTGKANWDIVKPGATAEKPATAAKPFKIDLQKYSIHNGYLRFSNEGSAMHSEIIHLDHEGRGDFTADLFTLQTKTTADEVNFSYGGIPYLKKVKTSIGADLNIDNTQKKYSFETDKIKLNDLQLSTKGFVQLASDSAYNMDINFKAPSTDFKNILSFVPAIYQNNFAGVKTSGQAVFNGFVKGMYSSNQIPAYNINLNVKNGFFQYPDLPKPVKNINFLVNIDNPDGVTDHTVVKLTQGHIEMDNNPFDFRLLVKTPVSDLFVDAAAKGKLDLSKITDFVKLTEGTKLSGIIDANASVNGYANAIKKQQYNNFNAQGTIGLQNFLYASKDYPAGVQLDNLLMTFNPKNVTLNNAAGRFLQTSFSANGTIDNLLPYMFAHQPLTGIVNVKAGNINLNEWMGLNTDTSTKAAASATPFIVPQQLDITLNAAADKVLYDKIEMTAISGTLQIVDETIKLNNVKGNALDGTMSVSGFYSTKKNKQKPDISLVYDVKNVDIQKTFLAFNTVQKLMPIGQFLAGKLSSQLSVNGQMGGNMMPDISSLTGNGNLLLLEGVLSKFQPVEKLAQSLNVSALQKVSVKDVKSFFEFANGKVLVKPFTLKVKDIDMEIGGLHGIDQSMDYTLNLKIPRALIGAGANTAINGLVSKINSNGVPLNLADKIGIQAKMGGSISNPTISTNLKQSATSLAQDMKQQAVGFVTAKIDSTKKAATAAIKDTVASVKKQLLQTGKEELAKKLFGEKDTTGNAPTDTKKKIEEAGKGLLKNLNPFKKNQ